AELQRGLRSEGADHLHLRDRHRGPISGREGQRAGQLDLHGGGARALALEPQPVPVPRPAQVGGRGHLEVVPHPAHVELDHVEIAAQGLDPHPRAQADRGVADG
ncbi:MAG: hypothetical protein ACK559_01205, partial [bacterium]